MRRKQWQWKSLLPVTLLYVGCVLLRYALATVTSAYPTVGIDEFLYYSLGRSIATEGTLLYRGQPALYNYLLYPLALTPIYLIFPQGSDFYRLMQLWNFMLMSLAVFPVYGLCGALLKDKKKALWMTLLVMLFPDFILGQFIFSETLIYPLFYTLMYCAYRYMTGRERRFAVWTGVLGALLYNAKPGAIVPAVGALLFFLIRGLREKNKKQILDAVLGAVSLGAVFGLFWFLAKGVFAYSGSFLSLYSKQLEFNLQLSWGGILWTVLMYPFYLLLGCGILPFLLPILKYRRFGDAHRRYYLLTLLSLIATTLGTALLINGTEQTYMLITRYMAMYLPMMLLFSVTPEDENRRTLQTEKSSRWALGIITALLGYCAACTAIWGATAGIGGSLDNHFAISVSALYLTDAKGIANVTVLVCCCLFLYVCAKAIPEKKRNIIVCCAYVLTVLVNTCAGYAIIKSNAFPTATEDAKETQQAISDGDYLYIYSVDLVVSDAGLDLYSKRNVAHVALYDFYNNVMDNGGVYTPFVPESERGMVSNIIMPDVSTLVLDYTVTPMIKFSENAAVTHRENSKFTVVRFERGQRLVDSVVADVENFTLGPDFPGILAIFKPEWRSQPIKLKMEIESPIDQDMEFFNARHYKIPLKAGRYSYEFIIQEPEIGYNFTTANGIHFYSYEITPADAAQ